MQSMLVQPKDDRFYIPITARASHHHLSTMGCLSLGQFLYLSEPHSSQEPNLENLSRQWLLEIPMSNGDDQAIQLPSAQRNMRTMQWIMFKINKYFQYDTIPGIDPVRLQIVQRHQYRHDFDYGTVMRYKGTNLETILRYARCAGFRVACVCNTGWKPEYSDFIRDRLRLEFLIGISKADQIRCIEEWCSMLLEAMVVHLHAVIGRSNMGRFIAGCLEDNYKDFQLLSSTVYTTLGERDSYVLQAQIRKAVAAEILSGFIKVADLITLDGEPILDGNNDDFRRIFYRVVIQLVCDVYVSSGTKLGEVPVFFSHDMSPIIQGIMTLSNLMKRDAQHVLLSRVNPDQRAPTIHEVFLFSDTVHIVKQSQRELEKIDVSIRFSDLKPQLRQVYQSRQAGFVQAIMGLTQNDMAPANHFEGLTPKPHEVISDELNDVLTTFVSVLEENWDIVGEFWIQQIVKACASFIRRPDPSTSSVHSDGEASD